MRNLMKFNILAIAIIVALGVSSCLKDDAHYWDYSNAKAVIEIPEAPNPASGLIVRTIEVVPSITINLPVNLASPNTVGKDLTVTLALDPALIDEKNMADTAGGAEGTVYEQLPDSVYTIASLTVTIPAGKRLVQLPIVLKSDKIDLTANYILPLKIASVPEGYTIASNFSKALIAIIVKNKYDGVYEVTGTMVDHGNANFTGFYPFDYHLITSGPNQVICYDATVWEDIMHPMLNAGALSGYGSFGLIVNFAADGSGKIESVINYYGQPAGNGRYAELDATGVNTWDADTKVVNIKYQMWQLSVVPDGPRVEFDETWTYTGPRP